jgi:hypothetical protein
LPLSKLVTHDSLADVNHIYHRFEARNVLKSGTTHGIGLAAAMSWSSALKSLQQQGTITGFALITVSLLPVATAQQRA